MGEKKQIDGTTVLSVIEMENGHLINTFILWYFKFAENNYKREVTAANALQKRTISTSLNLQKKTFLLLNPNMNYLYSFENLLDIYV